MDRRLFVFVNIFHARHVREFKEHNDRLTNGPSLNSRPLSIPGCGPLNRCFFVFVKPFHARHAHEFACRSQSYSIDAESKTWIYHEGSERGGGRQGGGARRSGAGQDGTPTGRFAQEMAVPRAL